MIPAAIVLAGGRGRRFQKDGPWIDKLTCPGPLGPPLAVTATAARSVARRVLVMTRRDRLRRYRALLPDNLAVGADPVRSPIHPMSGLYGGLRRLRGARGRVLVLSADRPGLTEGPLRAFVRQAREGTITALSTERGRPDPLLAVYPLRLLREGRGREPSPGAERMTDLIRRGSVLDTLTPRGRGARAAFLDADTLRAAAIRRPATGAWEGSLDRVRYRLPSAAFRRARRAERAGAGSTAARWYREEALALDRAGLAGLADHARRDAQRARRSPGNRGGASPSPVAPRRERPRPPARDEARSPVAKTRPSRRLRRALGR